jgi:hypothetical protein
MDDIFPAEVHSERVRRTLAGQGFGNIEVVRVGGASHTKASIFRPEDGAVYVAQCGRLPLSTMAAIAFRSYPSLAIVLAALVGLILARALATAAAALYSTAAGKGKVELRARPQGRSDSQRRS